MRTDSGSDSATDSPTAGQATDRQTERPSGERSTTQTLVPGKHGLYRPSIAII